MISYEDLKKLRRGNLMTRLAQADQLQNSRVGVEVVILVAARYNGPDHKQIGDKELQAGDIVTIAGGDYYQFLKKRMMVISVADAAALQSIAQQSEDGMDITDDGEPTGTGEANTATDGWRIFLDGGLTEAQAKTIYAAGITSKEKVVDAGNETIVALGVSKTKAAALVKWANS